MVSGAEEFRTTLSKAIQLEKSLRGSTAGFNMPQFVIDLPNGGGKRLVSSFDSYDLESGISVFYSPHVTKNNEKLFFYFDPIRSIAPKYQQYNSHQFIQLINEQFINRRNKSFFYRY